MKKTLYLVIFLYFISYFCTFAQFKSQVYPNGKTKFEGSFSAKDSLKQGPWRYYFNTGKLNSEGAYFNGKMHSEWRFYHETTGNIQKIENWIEGFQKGITKEFYPSGKLEKSFMFKNGVYNGLFLSYFEDGTIHKKGYYSNGIPEGTWQTFLPKNIVKEEGYFVEGKENGWFRYYDDNGVLLSEISFIEGIKQNDFKDYKVINSKKKKRKK